jgi:hypothetical protein
MAKAHPVCCHDAVMKRTTISLPEDLARRLEREAARRSVSEAEVVREALTEHLGSAEAPRRPLPFPPASPGSGRTDISANIDAALAEAGFGEDALRR